MCSILFIIYECFYNKMLTHYSIIHFNIYIILFTLLLKNIKITINQ
jgi:hypothetical protein